MIIASAPFATEKDNARYMKRMRALRKQYRVKYPALMKRLEKMTENELLLFQIGLLRQMPDTHENAYHLRTLQAIIDLRSAPPPARPAPVHADKRPPNAPNPPLIANPSPAPPVATPVQPAPLQQTDVQATNVIPFNSRLVPKCFHSGRSSARWIGGET